ncbi:MAG: LytTR family DNA-binding domain-containing protein [Bacteroidia bacterium]
MKLLIIEDEEPASERLERLLKEIDPSTHILDKIVSVKSAVNWLKKNVCPDLVMMDIQLSDGNSFEIFKEVKIDCPIIFITAFDQYAIDAFKFNSIDYLLKPVNKEALSNAILKFQKQHAHPAADYSKLYELIKINSEKFQKRLLIRFKDIIKTIELGDVAYFFVENKITYLVTHTKMQYTADNNLDELEKILDPQKFFRINRQFIVNIDAIEKMVAYTKSRVKLVLIPTTSQDTIVSTERSPGFKEWLLGKS